MKRVPFPHQIEAAEYLHKNQSGFLCMKPRTGKTLSSILGASKCKVSPLLVICPNTVKAGWYDELAYFLGREKQDRIQLVEGTKRQRLEQLGGDSLIFICNFEMLKAYDVLSIKPWKGIIVDESYRIANEANKVTKYLLRKTPESCEFRVCLTGIPSPENPLNLVTQHLFAFKEFMGYTEYGDYIWDNWRYCKYERKYLPYDKKHPQAMLDYHLSKAFCLTLEDLGKGSKRLYRTLRVPADLSQEIMLAEILDPKFTYVKKGVLGQQKILKLDPLVKGIFVQLISCGIHPIQHEVLSTSKQKFIAQYIQETLGKESVVVFSRFILDIETVAKELKEVGISCEIITGETPIGDRDILRKRFQKGEFQVVVAQVKTVKMGLDFSIADTIIYSSNSFSCDDRLQSEERIINLNKSRPVEIIDVCTVYPNGGSFDISVSDTLKAKESISSQYVQRIKL